MLPVWVNDLLVADRCAVALTRHGDDIRQHCVRYARDLGQVGVADLELDRSGDGNRRG